MYMAALMAVAAGAGRPAADRDLLPAILVLTGAGSAEELDEAEVERYVALAERPLPLNRAPRARLLTLLTPFQAASLVEYRAEHGDVLSLAELSLVDGFGEAVAAALGPFVSLEAAGSGGPGDGQALVVRGGMRVEEGTDGGAAAPAWRAGARYRLTFGGRWEVALAGRNAYGEPLFPPSAGTLYAVYHGRRGKVVVGDFNARFGQGLALWTGFSLDGLSSVSAFSRRPALLTPAWSYTGSGTLRGVAADLRVGRCVVSAFAASPLLRGTGERSATAGANVTWLARGGEVGLTVYASGGGMGWEDVRVSLDGRWHVGRTDLSGEAAVAGLPGVGAVKGGASFRAGDGVRLALQLRAIPSGYSGKKHGEYGAAAGMDWTVGRYVALRGRTGFGASVRRMRGSVTVEGAALPVPGGDVGRRQLRSVVSGAWQVSPAVALSLRATGRLRNDEALQRADVRIDADWSDGRWSARLRGHAAVSQAVGWLGYAEVGRSDGRGSVHLRGTVFRADTWADRVYCYERDVPGSFTVPAYHGHGYAVSLLGGRAFRAASLRCRTYLRAAWRVYLPSSPVRHPARLDITFQLHLDL